MTMLRSTTPDHCGRYAWGLLRFRDQQVYYELVERVEIQEQPGVFGGIVRIPVRQGGFAWRARILFTASEVAITPELERAIALDQDEQRGKP